nr:MAG TPA: hypothetical protein [Caudoviricetes sp.]
MLITSTVRMSVKLRTNGIVNYVKLVFSLLVNVPMLLLDPVS